MKERAISSAVEHLPYKEIVTGSIPVSPISRDRWQAARVLQALAIAVVAWPLLRSMSTPFPLSEVLPLRAMRLYTDGKRALLGKSMGIEIGGAHDGRNST